MPTMRPFVVVAAVVFPIIFIHIYMWHIWIIYMNVHTYIFWTYFGAEVPVCLFVCLFCLFDVQLR